MKILKFIIKDDKYALDLDSVKEIIKSSENITPVPLAPDYVKGLINLRGNIIPILSPILKQKCQHIIIITKEDQLFGLEVDSAESIEDLSRYNLDQKTKQDILFDKDEMLIYVKDLKQIIPGFSI